MNILQPIRIYSQNPLQNIPNVSKSFGGESIRKVGFSFIFIYISSRSPVYGPGDVVLNMHKQTQYTLTRVDGYS